MANGGPQRHHHEGHLLDTTDEEATTLTAVEATSASASSAVAAAGSGFRGLDTTVADVTVHVPSPNGHGDVGFHRAPAPRAIDDEESADSNSSNSSRSSSSSLLQDGGVRIAEEPPHVALSQGDGRGNPADQAAAAAPAAWSEGARVVGFRLAVQQTESSSYTQVSGIPNVHATESPPRLSQSLPQLPGQIENHRPAAPVRPFPTPPDLPAVVKFDNRAWRRRPSFLATPRGGLPAAAPLRMAQPPLPPRAVQCRLVLPLAALRPAAATAACVANTDEQTTRTSAWWSIPAGAFTKSRRARRRRMSEPPPLTSAARYHGHSAGRRKTGTTTIASTSTTTTPAKDRAGIQPQQAVRASGQSGTISSTSTKSRPMVATCNIQISVVERHSSGSNCADDDDDGWWPPDPDGDAGGVGEKATGLAVAARLRRRPPLANDWGSPEWSGWGNYAEEEPSCCLCQMCRRLVCYLTLWLCVYLFTYGVFRLVLSWTSGKSHGRYPYYMGPHSCCLVGAQIAFWPSGAAAAYADVGSLRLAVVAQLVAMAAAEAIVPDEQVTRDCCEGGGRSETSEEPQLLMPCGGAVAYAAKARSLLSSIPNRPVVLVQLLRRIGYLPRSFGGVGVSCRSEPPLTMTHVSLDEVGGLELNATSGRVPAGFFPALSGRHWLPPVLVALPAWLPGGAWAGGRVRLLCRAEDGGPEQLPEREVLLEMLRH